MCNLATPLIRLSFCLPSRSLLRLNGSRADPLLPLRLLWQSSDFRHQVHRSPSVSRYNSFLREVDSLLLPVVNIQHYLLIHFFFFFKCAGEHGAVRVPRGGERGFSRGRFQAQSAASHQRWTRLEHPVAELGSHCCWEQVGGAASALSHAFHTEVDCDCERQRLLPSYSEILAVACSDRMLSVFSSCGRRLLPAIQLGMPVSALHCTAHFVMALTAGATLSVWSVL